MSTQVPNKVGIKDVVRGAVKMVPDLPNMVRHVPGMIVRPPAAKRTIGQIFAKLAADHPDRPFIRSHGETLTYGEVNRQVNRYAAVLAGRGVGTGDVVGILAKNSPTDLMIILATLKLGAVAGMLNYNQRGEVIDHSMKLLGGKALIYDPECIEAYESISPDRLPEHVLDYPALDTAAEGKSEENPAVTKTPPAAVLLKKAAGIETASGEPNRTKVAKLARSKVREIAELKMPDLNAADVESAVRMVEGTARSMGIDIVEG